MNQTNQENFIDDNDINDNEDIAVEDTDFKEKITEPFDPSKIRVDSKQLSVDSLLTRFREGELELTPDFQRKAGLWKDDAQSQLIESLLIRIPLPAFYMDATNDNKWLVVDGLQRLTTFKRFVLDKTLRLQGLEFLQNLEGKTYDEIVRHLQRRINETQLTVYLIDEGTPPDVKFNIFKRINTGGLPLSPQEIRHALYQGNATKLLAKLADSDEFKKVTANRMQNERMEDRAFILRLFVGSSRYSMRKNIGNSLESSNLLNNLMMVLNKMSRDELDKVEEQFKRFMLIIFEIFGKDALIKNYRSMRDGKGYNKYFLESFFINLGTLNNSQLQLIVKKKNTIKMNFKKLVNEHSVNYLYNHRFTKIKQLIEEVLA
jgi:hypothetical protein